MAVLCDRKFSLDTVNSFHTKFELDVFMATAKGKELCTVQFDCCSIFYVKISKLHRTDLQTHTPMTEFFLKECHTIVYTKFIDILVCFDKCLPGKFPVIFRDCIDSCEQLGKLF